MDSVIYYPKGKFSKELIVIRPVPFFLYPTSYFLCFFWHLLPPYVFTLTSEFNIC